MDSTVLLHALSQAKPDHIHLKALHIHHGLQPQADQWLVDCQSLADQWQVTFVAKRVKLDPADNLEAAARKARYQVFGEWVGTSEAIVTAHHQRDQAETFLLNLMRGAGIAGLAGIPIKRPLETEASRQAWVVRPLLNLSYHDLLRYAKTHKLNWVEDPMNHQLHYRRNFIRHQLLPIFNQAWSTAECKIAQAAEHCAEADQLLMQLAQLDIQTIEHRSDRIDWVAIRQLDWVRQKNVLRYWFNFYHQCRLNQSDLDWFRNECFKAQSSASPQRIIAGKLVRRYLNFIYYPIESKQEFDIVWQKGTALESVGSALKFSQGEGIAQHWFEAPNRIQIRCLQPSDLIKRSSLKKWFQQHKIPPWQRTAWPVLIVNGELAAIRDYCVLPNFIAKQNETGVKFVALN